MLALLAQVAADPAAPSAAPALTTGNPTLDAVLALLVAVITLAAYAERAIKAARRAKEALAGEETTAISVKATERAMGQSQALAARGASIAREASAALRGANRADLAHVFDHHAAALVHLAGEEVKAVKTEARERSEAAGVAERLHAVVERETKGHDPRKIAEAATPPDGSAAAPGPRGGAA